MEKDTDARERLFHDAVREILIHFLFFLALYVLAYVLISKFKKKKEYYFVEDDEDAIVYRISLWMCCFSLAVSLGAALLLPVSIISNEVLLLYPSSFYVQWLNSSLIHGLWNEIFLFSNVSIFILLPFAYLFTESEGLPGSRKGLISRLYETFLVLVLVAALLFGMTFLLSAILDYGQTSIQSFLALWSGYLPFLYSCLSCLGVVLLLICTPVGFARLFTVLGELVIKPKFLRDIQDEYQCAMMEEENLRRRAHIVSHELEIHYSAPAQRNGTNGRAASVLQRRLLQLGKMRSELAVQQLASPWRRNLGYPLAMLALLSLTIISLLMVIHNTLQLLIGIKALPFSQVEQFSLGISSLSALGVVGSSLEIVLILYLWLASVVGFFTLPVFCLLRPKPLSATLTQIIGNCAVLLVLSSALPVLARTLVSDRQLQEIREEVLKDAAMTELCTYSSKWPESKHEVSEAARAYWNYRDELHVEDGLLLRSNKLVIPPTKRQEVLCLLHAAHGGQEKMKARAKAVMYWPGMSADITALAEACQLCQWYKSRNARLPMLSLDIPTLPWQVVGVDLFYHEGDEYLVMVDFYSFFFEIKQMR